MCVSVCSSHAVAVVVVAPLLAMTGDVDAMCTIHFGVSFVRSYLSVSVSFFCFVRCRRHIIFTLVKCFCLLLLSSLLCLLFAF